MAGELRRRGMVRSTFLPLPHTFGHLVRYADVQYPPFPFAEFIPAKNDREITNEFLSQSSARNILYL